MSVESSSDQTLLDRFAAQRNEAAFASLVGRHMPLVLAACRRVLGNHHDAEDAAQAVFLVLARKAHAIDARRTLGPWLHRVAIDLARDALRSRHSRERINREAAPMSDPAPPPALTGEIDAALAELPERERVAITLFHLEGRTVEEVAGLLDRPVGTVCSWLSRGRDRRRSLLRHRGEALPVTALVASLGSLGATEVPARLVAATAKTAVAFALTGSAAAPAALPEWLKAVWRHDPARRLGAVTGGLLRTMP